MTKSKCKKFFIVVSLDGFIQQYRACKTMIDYYTKNQKIEKIQYEIRLEKYKEIISLHCVHLKLGNPQSVINNGVPLLSYMLDFPPYLEFCKTNLINKLEKKDLIT